MLKLFLITGAQRWKEICWSKWSSEAVQHPWGVKRKDTTSSYICRNFLFCCTNSCVSFICNIKLFQLCTTVLRSPGRNSDDSDDSRMYTICLACKKILLLKRDLSSYSKLVIISTVKMCCCEYCQSCTFLGCLMLFLILIYFILVGGNWQWRYVIFFILSVTSN